MATAQTVDPAFAKVGIFGVSSSAQRTKQLELWVPQMVKIGLNETRTVRTSWNLAQPVDANSWDWKILDEQLKYVEGQKMHTGGLLSGVAPAWNKLDDPRGLPMKNLEGWSRYVYEIVKHTKGRIKYWEIWNEPPNGTKNAPASDYAKVVVAAYDAAKKADPTCKIGIAAKSVHLNYLDQALVAGAKNHFDYITLHPYEVLGTAMKFPGTEAIYMHIAPTVRKMLAARNPERVNAPIWLTELGVDSRKGEDIQAQMLVKAYAMGIAQGFTSIDW